MTSAAVGLVAREVRLQEQLHAMRHLRPGTKIATPAGLLQQQVMADLLHLPEDTEALRWLRNEAQARCVHLGLRYVVQHAIQVRRNLRYADNARAVLGASVHPREQSPLLGGLLASTTEWEASVAWAGEVPNDVPTEQLLEVLAQMRQAAGLPRGTGPDHSEDRASEEYLLADLLCLPEETDPLRWLSERRSATCAWLTLRHLVRQSLPPLGPLMAGPGNLPLLRPRTRLSAGPTLHVIVEQVVFFELGFSAKLHARITARAQEPNDIVAWDGFDRVMDDEGYCYIVQAVDQSANNSFRGWKAQVTLVCYPAVETARTLTWLAQPAVLTRRRPPEDGGHTMISLPSPGLGDLRWTLRIR
jgi:hypothetical protein